MARSRRGVDARVVALVVNRVLMIAYHYPPIGVSSGLQRTLKFSTYLPEFGWHPSVLTVQPRAYETRRDDQLAEIPRNVVVRRAFALDTARHLSIRGRFPLLLALPDKWVSWWLGGVYAGLKMIRETRPQVLWSTYPIPTALLIGLTLHRLTGLPWVADCRDSLIDDHHPAQSTVRRVYRWIEQQTVRRAARVVFTTFGTLEMYRARYPNVPPERWTIVENGYDENNFVAASIGPGVEPPTGQVVLVHAGILYPLERDPTRLFDALTELKQEGRISAATLRIRLRGTMYDHVFRPELERRGIDDIVTLDPAIAYEAALREMLGASGLLVFQAANSNHQIPAKLYEYFRARRPVLGLVDPAGDTARAMREAGLNAIAPLDDKQRIKETLVEFLAQIAERTAEFADEQTVARSSRRGRTAQLAELLDSIVAAEP